MLVFEDRFLLRQLHGGNRDALCRIYEKYRIELFTIAVSLLGDRDFGGGLPARRVRPPGGIGRSGAGREQPERVLGKLPDQPGPGPDPPAGNLTGCSAEGLGCCGAEPSPVQRLADDEQTAALLKAIGQLPGEQREVFVLHAQAGLSFREIARIQETPLRTVHSRYRYAIEKLRELLREGIEP